MHAWHERSALSINKQVKRVTGGDFFHLQKENFLCMQCFSQRALNKYSSEIREPTLEAQVRSKENKWYKNGCILTIKINIK
jgi:hypothetical protein